MIASIASIDDVLDCIFPDDYYSGNTEPKGNLVSPNLNALAAPNATNEFTAAATNLRTMVEIHSRLLQLGLKQQAVGGICHSIQKVIGDALQQQALENLVSKMDTSMSVGTQNDYTEPFGLLLKTTGDGYTRQLIADVKKTMRANLETTSTANPAFFSTEKISIVSNGQTKKL